MKQLYKIILGLGLVFLVGSTGLYGQTTTYTDEQIGFDAQRIIERLQQREVSPEDIEIIVEQERQQHLEFYLQMEAEMEEQRQAFEADYRQRREAEREQKAKKDKKTQNARSISTMSTTTTTTAVSASERQALIDLYNATDGPNWKNKTNWNTTADVSTWYGVTVTDGKVTDIVLRRNNLTGYLPASIGDLVNLEYLDLYYNNLTGNLPLEIGNMVSLEFFNLAYNKVTGILPSQIGNLIKLNYINLERNLFNGTIPAEIGNLTNLETLMFHYNDFEGFLPSSIGNLTNLKDLNLASNELTGNIPIEFGGLNNIITLNISYNELSGSIPSSLGNLINLQNLNLNYNNLTGQIPNEILTLTNLKSLSLGYNNLDGTLPSNISNLINLQYLYLASNEFTGVIPIEIGDLVQLKELRLDYNKFTGTIPVQLRNLNNLTILQLTRNNLTGGLDFLVNNNLAQLLGLSLYGNYLEGSIPVEIGSLTNLISLSIAYNQLTGIIPTQIGQLQNLRSLSLYSNSLTGPIPIEIGNCLDLSYLYLQSNNLSGPIPSELSNCENLSRIDLYGNELSGEIPSSLGQLQKLANFIVYSNKLTGSIPEELGNALSLTSIYVNNNKMEGSIPASLASLPKLTTLAIGINKFSGEMPLFNGTGMRSINMNNNSFLFRDIEVNHNSHKNLIIYQYYPQAKVDQLDSVVVSVGGSYTLSSSMSSPNNSYQWYKDGVAISGATAREYVISGAASSDAGRYYVSATNSIVTGLTLVRHDIVVSVEAANLSNSFCDLDSDIDPLVGDLSPGGSTIRWYLTETGGTALASTDELVLEVYDDTGATYWWEDINSPGSGRTSVQVYVGRRAPEGDLEQYFSMYGPTAQVSDIEVYNSGDPVYWYSDAQGVNAVSNSATLVDGTTYYASSCAPGDTDCGCLLPVTVYVGIVPVAIDALQFVCPGSSLSDVPVELEPNLLASWYSDSSGGSPLPNSQAVVDGMTYYLSQRDASGNESPRVGVTLYVIGVEAPLVSSSTQFFTTDRSHTVGDLQAYGSGIRWYSQASGGVLYDPSTLLTDGATYYAEQQGPAGSCYSATRSAVSVVLSPPDSDLLVGCELFRPQPLGNYVIDAWLNERSVVEQVIAEIPFNGSSEASLFVSLLNHFRDRLLSGDSQLLDISEVYKPVLSAGASQNDLNLLMPYINGADVSEKQLLVYDFTREKDSYGRTIGFSFYLNAQKTHKIRYLTPEIVRNGVTESDHYPMVVSAGQSPESFLDFTGVEVDSNGNLVISSTFNQQSAPAYQGSQQGNLSDSGALRFDSVKYDYSEVGYQALSSYSSAKVEVSFLDESGQPLNTPVVLSPQGPIIDNWQRVSATFEVPADAGRMIVSLKNTDQDRLAYFDDLRIHPVTGTMKTFVYHPENQRLTAELDENNYATYYEYDLEGGLVRVKKETERGVYTIQETRSSSIKRSN